MTQRTSSIAQTQANVSESEGRLLVSRLFTNCRSTEYLSTKARYDRWAHDNSDPNPIHTVVHPWASIDLPSGTLRLLREDKLGSCLARSRMICAGERPRDRMYLITLEKKGTFPSEEIPLGYVNVVDWTLSSPDNSPGIKVNKTLRLLGFWKGIEFAHIDLFYPLNDAPELKMNGIGAAVLSHLVGELESEGYAGALLTNVSLEMEGFLEHSSFRKVNGLWLKIFGEVPSLRRP